MKVNNWRGNEGNCAQDYINCNGRESNTQDIFQEYNSSIDAVIKKTYGTLATAYGKIVDVRKRVEGADTEIANLNNQLAKARSDIQMAGQSKMANLNQLIERKRKEYIDGAVKYTDAQIAQAKHDMDKFQSDWQATGPQINDHEIRERILASKGEAGAVSSTAKSVLDHYNCNYGEFNSRSSNGGWSVEFFNLYQKFKAETQGDSDVMMRVGGEDYTKQKVLDKFEGSYKKNPYSIFKILLYLICFPLAIVRYKYNEPNWLKCVLNIFNDIKLNNNRFKTVAMLGAWAFQWYSLFYLKWYYMAMYLVVVVTLTTCFILSKKKIHQIIKEMVEIDVCYEMMVGSIDAQVQAEIDAEKKRLTDQANAKWMSLRQKWESMVKENEAAIEQAKRTFDPNAIDNAELEADYRRMVADMQNRVRELENRIQSCKEQKAKLQEENRPLLVGYDEAKSKVRQQLSTDGEDLAFSINGKPFNFVFAQIDAQTILKSNSVINALGLPITLTGRLINSADAATEATSDLPPATIPINLTALEKEQVKVICAEYPWYENVYEELNTIMSSVDQEIKKALGSAANGDIKFDFSRFYKFTLVEHGLRCAVVFFNSHDDINSRKTVADLCTHNIIHPTVCTTDKRGLSFRIFPNDRTSFDAMDYGLGASVEERNSMESSHFYEVYDANDRDKVVSDLYNNALTMSKEIGSSSRNVVEYRAKKINGGSSPTRLTYAIFTDEVDRFWNDTLRSIMYGTGGTQSGGHDAAGENTYGIVPILFLDLAPLVADKPDSTSINKIEEVAKAAAVRNFFYIKSGASTLTKYNRQDVLQLINRAREKAR